MFNLLYNMPKKRKVSFLCLKLFPMLAHGCVHVQPNQIRKLDITTGQNCLKITIKKLYLQQYKVCALGPSIQSAKLQKNNNNKSQWSSFGYLSQFLTMCRVLLIEQWELNQPGMNAVLDFNIVYIYYLLKTSVWLRCKIS